MYELSWTQLASQQYAKLESAKALKAQFKAVKKCLKFLAENPRHTGLNTHEWHEEKCPHGGKQFEAYAQNKTPGAYRVFWCYVPKPTAIAGAVLAPDAPKVLPGILIVAITPHP